MTYQFRITHYQSIDFIIPKIISDIMRDIFVPYECTLRPLDHFHSAIYVQNWKAPQKKCGTRRHNVNCINNIFILILRRCCYYNRSILFARWQHSKYIFVWLHINFSFIACQMKFSVSRGKENFNSYFDIKGFRICMCFDLSCRLHSLPISMHLNSAGKWRWYVDVSSF